MTALKTIGLVTLGAAVSALVGGGVYYWLRRRKSKQEIEEEEGPQRVVPSRPPREVGVDGDDVDSHAKGDLVNQAELPDALESVLNKMFSDTWPPDDETIDNLTTADVVVVAAKSRPVPGYENSRTELIAAKVRSVERTHVRARRGAGRVCGAHRLARGARVPRRRSDRSAAHEGARGRAQHRAQA